MDEEQWLTSSRPGAMLEYLRYGGGDPFASNSGPSVQCCTDRKLRLVSSGLLRLAKPGGWEKGHTAYHCDLVIEEVERWADGVVPPRGWEMHGIKLSPFEMVRDLCSWADHWGVTAEMKCALFREIFGNPFRPVQLDLRLRYVFVPYTSIKVVSLAERIYETRDWSGLLVLADALEEAGCTEEGLLRHLRGQIFHAPMLADYLPEECRENGNITHFRGCWALDAVLGRK